MNIKYVFADADYTLVGKNQIICEKNVCAINEAREKGIHFVLATGRVPANADKLLKGYGAYGKDNEYVVCANGALITNCKGDIIYQNSISREDCLDLIHLLIKIKNINICCATSYRYFYINCNGLLDRSREDAWFISFDEMIEVINNNSIYKMQVTGNDTDLLLEIAKLINVSTVGRVYGVPWSKYGIDVMNANMTKGNGVLMLKDKLGFGLKETLVIGDNYNDLSMFNLEDCLKACPYNAEDKIKDKSDYVSTYVCDDGAVADILRKLVLI